MKELNLLPNNYKERFNKNNMLKKFSIYLIGFSIIALGFNILPYYILRHNQNMLSQLELTISDERYIDPVEISNRIIDLRSELGLYEDTYKKLAYPIISDLETYKQLIAQLPDKVKIDTITFTNSDRIVLISGISDSRKLVSEFVTNLSNLQTVNEVTMLELELDGERPKDNSIDYHIQVYMNTSEDII